MGNVFRQEAIKIKLLTKNLCWILCWILPKNAQFSYNRNMIITFSQSLRNSMVGYEILFRLMLKFQSKNYPCLLEKTILTTLRLKFSDVPLDEFWIYIEGAYK